MAVAGQPPIPAPLDGTCITLPRWKRLGEHFGYARNKNGAPRPQARMVMLLLAGVRVPWRYELTPRSQGESTVAGRLLAHAPQWMKNWAPASRKSFIAAAIASTRSCVSLRMPMSTARR